MEFDKVWNPGDLAIYYPTFGGPMKCKVIGYRIRNAGIHILVKITSKNVSAGYACGEVIEAKVQSDGVAEELFKRDAVRVRNHKYVATFHTHSVKRLPLLDF